MLHAAASLQSTEQLPWQVTSQSVDSLQSTLVLAPTVTTHEAAFLQSTRLLLPIVPLQLFASLQSTLLLLPVETLHVPVFLQSTAQLSMQIASHCAASLQSAAHPICPAHGIEHDAFALHLHERPAQEAGGKLLVGVLVAGPPLAIPPESAPPQATTARHGPKATASTSPIDEARLNIAGLWAAPPHLTSSLQVSRAPTRTAAAPPLSGRFDPFGLLEENVVAAFVHLQKAEAIAERIGPIGEATVRPPLHRAIERGASGEHASAEGRRRHWQTASNRLRSSECVLFSRSRRCSPRPS
jgi:hypothetical protein